MDRPALAGARGVKGRGRGPRPWALAPAELARFAAEYQAGRVVPHCGACRRPCCRLETLVLELDWRRLKALWGLEVSRRELDDALARGDGPPELRAADGFYYAHRRVCPAYDEEGRRCRVYETSVKPTGCGDFPVYEDQGRLVADLRCEAVDLAALEEALRRRVGGAGAVRVTRDPEFPFLVTLEVRRAGGRRPPGAGSGGISRR